MPVSRLRGGRYLAVGWLRTIPRTREQSPDAEEAAMGLLAPRGPVALVCTTIGKTGDLSADMIACMRMFLFQGLRDAADLAIRLPSPPMSSSVFLHVGQCGNQVGEVFWRRAIEEYRTEGEAVWMLDFSPPRSPLTVASLAVQQ